MKVNIFEPLGIEDVSMLPSRDMIGRLAYMHQRTPDGVLHPRDHPLRTPLVVQDEDELSRCFNSGGGGLFAKPREYCSKSSKSCDIRLAPAAYQTTMLTPPTCTP